MGLQSSSFARELFQVRSAGNTAFAEAIASLEYAVSALGTPLILVLGHSGAALCRQPWHALRSHPYRKTD